MKTITKFKADDGREFVDKYKCLAHEAILGRIKNAMREWPKSPDGCSFTNGGGFLKIPMAVYQHSKDALLDLAIAHCDHEDWAQRVKAGVLDVSYLGRVFDDSNSPLYEPWLRVMCVDKQFREWGQCYFATHPEEGKQVCLNP